MLVESWWLQTLYIKGSPMVPLKLKFDAWVRLGAKTPYFYADGLYAYAVDIRHRSTPTAYLDQNLRVDNIPMRHRHRFRVEFDWCLRGVARASSHARHLLKQGARVLQDLVKKCGRTAVRARFVAALNTALSVPDVGFTAAPPQCPADLLR